MLLHSFGPVSTFASCLVANIRHLAAHSHSAQRQQAPVPCYDHVHLLESRSNEENKGSLTSRQGVTQPGGEEVRLRFGRNVF